MQGQKQVAHQFAQVPTVTGPRSSFYRPSTWKGTFDADYLIPVFLDDCLPGDDHHIQGNMFARLATPLFPLMDQLYLRSYWFFVANRTIWDNWEKFQGAQDNPADSIDFTLPVFSNAGTIDVGTLHDYFGLPTGVANAYTKITSLPWRAYLKIFNEWFRDQNLQDEITFSTGDGPDDVTDQIGPLKRGKRHDYFTAGLPWPQKQTTDVILPIGSQAQITTPATSGSELFIDGPNLAAGTGKIGTGATFATAQTATGTVNMFADLENATGNTINAVRLAFATQHLLEIDARGGTRYVESIFAHWQVRVPDFRLQRAEYITGSEHLVNITPVAQTTYQSTPTDQDTKGALAAFGTVSGTVDVRYSCVEHGYLIGLVCVDSDLTYFQGIDRHWRRSTRYDFAIPALSGIGEQAVLNSEIYFQNTSADDDVFSYMPRYDEYRYKKSLVTGLLRPGVSGTLEPWVLTEEFTSLPTLGDAFIQNNTSVPLDRAIAVPAEPHFIGDFYFKQTSVRRLPIHGVPGLLRL